MMDFLDPKKSRPYTVKLIIGYILMAVILILATILLLDMASGFGVKNGKVIQNGLVYASSNPSGATIFLNGQQYNDKTNARLVLQAGTYTMKMTREGYRDWQRAVTVEGGSIDHFDYILFVPNQLTPSAIAGYQTAPAITTQSPDRRWLMVQPAGQLLNFDVYDLRNPEQVLATKTTISVPSGVFSLPQTEGQTVEVVEWSRDNDHVLLKHTVGEQSEYVMVSRDEPASSFNVTKRLQLAAGIEVSLQDKKFDRYFIHDTSKLTLSTATFNEPAAVSLLKDVVQFKSYGQDVIVYTSDNGAESGKTNIKLYQNKKSFTVRQINKHAEYLLDITTFDNNYYVAAGSAAENHIYVYESPAQRLEREPNRPLVPINIVKLTSPSYIEFSANSQFILVQNGQDVVTYDIDNDRSYTYRIEKPIDGPQTHIRWMDGYHLAYVSGGSAVMFDYDGTNVQTLAGANSSYQPFFDTAYQNLYTLNTVRNSATGANGGLSLYGTSLRTAADR